MLISFLIAWLLNPAPAFSASPSSSPASASDTWDLTPIYASDDAWRADFDGFSRSLSELRECKGRLNGQVHVLKKCLDLYFHLQMRLRRASAWASLQNAADVKSAKNGEREQLVEDLSSKFGEQSSFFEPELTHLRPAKVAELLKLPGASIYKQYLRSILDQAAHILDPSREALLASLSPVLGTGKHLQDLLLSADIEWPAVKLSTGKVKIDITAYTKLRESRHRDDRKKVFAAFFGVLSQFERSLGANLTSNVKSNVIMAKVRHYQNALDEALDGNKVPEEVYRTLIQQVNAGLPVFHKFLMHEAKSLGVKDYSYEDAYTSADDLALKFTLSEAESTVLRALAPLGDSYVNKLKSAFSQRWMDVYPREGKQQGAFMDGSVYEVHPFLLLDFQENFESVSTLAHEWGHAMHTLFSNGAQAFVNSEPSIFTAEIASTLNETLLHEHLIQSAPNAKVKAYYLGSLLQLIKGTFYRQTQFAEFELALHEDIEKGNALSGQRISEIYGRIARKYYGHDKGIMKVDEKYFTEWAFIPHFYNSFYVYQYATCISAAFYFAEQILAHKPGAVDNYFKVLKAGASKYPYEILKDAGVDMARPEVYQAVVRRADKALAELEGLK